MREPYAWERKQISELACGSSAASIPDQLGFGRADKQVKRRRDNRGSRCADLDMDAGRVLEELKFTWRSTKKATSRAHTDACDHRE